MTTDLQEINIGIEDYTHEARNAIKIKLQNKIPNQQKKPQSGYKTKYLNNLYQQRTQIQNEIKDLKQFRTKFEKDFKIVQ